MSEARWNTSYMPGFGPFFCSPMASYPASDGINRLASSRVRCPRQQGSATREACPTFTPSHLPVPPLPPLPPLPRGAPGPDFAATEPNAAMPCALTSFSYINHNGQVTTRPDHPPSSPETTAEPAPRAGNRREPSGTKGTEEAHIRAGLAPGGASRF